MPSASVSLPDLPKLPDLPGWAWAALGIGAAWVLMRPKQAVESVTKGAVNIVTGVGVGLVKGVGQAIGIPDTDTNKCAASLLASERDPWSFSAAFDVSRYCSASTFLEAAMGDLVPSAAAASSSAAPYVYPGGNQNAPVPAPKYDPKKPDASVLDILWGPSFEKQSGCILPGVTCSYGDSFDVGNWITEKNSQNRTITPVAGIRG